MHRENDRGELTEEPSEEPSVESKVESKVETSTPATAKTAAEKMQEAMTSDEELPTAESLGDEEPAEEGLDWYVIRVQSGREDTLSSKIRKKLQLANLDHFVRSIVVPKQKISEIKEGKKRVREMKLYPGYFFMEMQLVEEIWYLLRDTPGVGDFVGGGAKPIPMTAEGSAEADRRPRGAGAR